MSLLGELALPAGGVAWTQTIVTALGRLDVREKAARQALARMEHDGWLGRERIGRRTRWHLTPWSRSLLETGADRIYGFGGGEREWNGSWVVLMTSVPESDRPTRHRMAQQLGWSGFGSIGNGVWLSPWADREREAAAALRALGVEATSFRATLGSMGSGGALAAQAWDLPELEARYVDFLATVGGMAEPADGAEAAAELVTLVHAWRRFPFLDPDLPAALLPDGWPRRSAADAFAERRAALLPAARRWWTAAEGDGVPVSPG